MPLLEKGAHLVGSIEFVSRVRKGKEHYKMKRLMLNTANARENTTHESSEYQTQTQGYKRKVINLGRSIS